MLRSYLKPSNLKKTHHVLFQALVVWVIEKPEWVLLLTGRAYSSAPNGPVLPIHSGVRRQQKDYLHANVSDRALFAVNHV